MTSDPTTPAASPASGESLADALARQVTTRQSPAANLVVQSLHELGAVDRAVYEAVARTPTGTLDGPVRRLSAAADKSKLWLGIAAAVALAGGKRGRRAALEGVVAIGVSSATINLGVKPVARRRRPDRVRPALFEHRHVPMPGSTSFPSGHAASAFAFAYAVGRHLPAIAVPIRLLAAAVAYSRVHTGVHYPGDVVIGSVAGSGTAAMVAAVADRAARSRAVSDRAR
ncbi:MAG TPA: phosphatase PAP2 family protein [Actinomycetes bacterium]|nr:phosphatase PAP2 family protein [Actinomycetes bacterium]